MQRLTIKDNDDYCVVNNAEHIKYSFIGNYSLQNTINKLGQLEDIEEKMKCPLEVFLQIFSKGVYVKNEYTKDKIEYWNKFQIKILDVGSQWDICFIDSKSNKYAATFNYGKTWSLNKEDLENE